jgi:hypothetical protein
MHEKWTIKSFRTELRHEAVLNAAVGRERCVRPVRLVAIADECHGGCPGCNEPTLVNVNRGVSLVDHHTVAANLYM